MRSIFATEPHWTAQQRNKQYAPAAKPFERWLDFLRTDVWDQYATWLPFTLEVCKLGTSVLFNPWVDETYYRYDDASDATLPAGRILGPQPKWLPLEELLLPAGHTDPQTSPWMAARMWFSWTRLEMLQHNEIFQDIHLLRDAPDDETELRRRRRKYESAIAPRGDNARALGQGLWSPWCVYFQRDLDDDGYPEDYYMYLHAGTKTVLDIRPNPHLFGMRPFVVGKFVTEEGELYGRGVPETLADLQDEATTIHRQRRDNAHLANIRMFKGRTGSVLYDSIRPEAFKVIKSTDPEHDLFEFKLSDMRQVDAFEENIVLQMASDIVGESTLGGPITSPQGRAAATTIMAALQEGAERSDLNIANLRAAGSEQGAQIVELYQTYGMPEPAEPGAPEAILDPAEAQAVRDLMSEPNDLRGLMRLKLNVSTAAVNKEVEKQSAVQLLEQKIMYTQQVMQIVAIVLNPSVPPPVKDFVVRMVAGIDADMKNLFQAFGRFDLEATLAGQAIAELAQQSQMQPPMSLGAGAGGPAGPANGNGASGGPGAIDPAQIMAMLQGGGAGPQQ